MNYQQRQAVRYRFEGADMTVAEIRARWPAYSDSFLRHALRQGVSTLGGLAVLRERVCQTGKRNSMHSPWRKGTPGLRRPTA